MKNTIQHSPEQGEQTYQIPREYIYGLVQWKEDDLTDEDIVRMQGELLGSILVTWDIQTFQVLETERLKDILFSREDNSFFFTQTIDIQKIAEPWERETVLQTLKKIGAKSSVFERYAWWKRFSRNITWSSSLLQTQTCCI